MKRQNRQNIQRAEREGIVIREGTETDVHTFYRLHLATSQRQDFTPYPESYYAEMWRVLDPYGYIKLLLAEYRGEAVSALLLVPFADTVIAKKLGWAGLYACHRPNQLLFWEAIKWGKANGYRLFDLEGIDPTGAKAILAGEPLPESLRRTWTFFKLMFGGQVVLYPEAYDYVYNPLVRWAFGKLMPDFSRGSAIARVIEQLHRH
jgi:lipid II:glycine glycyltransferase (peptidoglycan interpeptide bridge formation enzyme)